MSDPNPSNIPLPPPPSDKEVNEAFQQIHELGTATESFFSRLYDNFTKRNELKKAQASLTLAQHQLHQSLNEKQRLASLVQNKQSELNRLYRILSRISEGIIMQDVKGRMVMINDAARQLIGSERNFWKSELGTLFNDYKDIQDVDSELALLGEPSQVEVNGHVLEAQLTAVGDSAGQRLGTIIIIRDITRDTLASRIKNSFVSHISHELNTPMNVMRVASEILMNQEENEPPNRRMLQLLSRNIDILDRMVDELLDVSEMSGGTFSIEAKPMLLTPIIWQVKETFLTSIAGAGLYCFTMIEHEESLTITGDDKRLEWAISHLVRNAIDYNERGGLVEISAGIEDNGEDSYVVLTVRDTGVGISPKDQANVFELFYRGEPITRSGKRLDPRGLGQGLYIARTIIEAHGGSLHMSTEVGQGSEFTVLLPYRAQPALAS
ncbi:HAMP domain-containing histidine kinase [Phototrophicus methaneseepsis]|uniref:histidine kinase n=1 Tax=Phototrophicus methaneseepsis TaxID=2710758 RepID=A0A7S8E7L2_9CHLR|nr:PAS domain-containing sensor histidine kinase [Phototrophicus methaneseepsis]QPC81773.1 HAMP domain-containing histidine kinase [Phototrophicus methaneseepsis]